MRKIEALERSDNKYDPTVRSSYAYSWNLECSDDSTFYPCHYFDYIAGTSTGAIIATGLARGMSIGKLIDFYKKTGAAMFEKSHLLHRLVSFYSADPLRKQLRDVFNAGNPTDP